MRNSPLMRVFRNTGALTIGVGARLALSFLFVIIVARYMGVEGFGKYALSQQLFDLFSGLSSTGLCILITREIARDRSRAGEILSAAFVLLAGLTLAAGGLLLLLSRFAGYDADTQSALLVVMLSLVPAGAGFLLEAVFVAYERAEFVTLGTVLECIIRIGLGAAALALGYGLLALMWALVVARVCTLIFYYVQLRRLDKSLRWKFQRSDLRPLIQHGKVFTCENWISTINGNFFTVALSIAAGEAAVGIFVAASKLLRLGTMAANSFRTAVFPHMSRLFAESREKLRDLCVESLSSMAIVLLPVVLATSIASDRVIDLLYSDQYAESVIVLRVLIWALLFECFSPFLSFILFARGQQSTSLRISIEILLVSVTVPLWLVVSYGAFGTAWASVVAEGFAFGLYAWRAVGVRDMRRILKLVLPMVLPIAAFAAFVWTFRQSTLAFLVPAAGVLYLGILYMLRVVLRKHQPGRESEMPDDDKNLSETEDAFHERLAVELTCAADVSNQIVS